jgi:type III pantothenate kinase
MLLAMDVGNTNIMFGVHDGLTWRHHWRVRTVRDKMADEYGVLVRSLLREVDLAMADFDRIVIASVVPPLTGRIEEMLAEQTRVVPLVISHTVETGLSFAVDNPAELGADLIADAVAAYGRLRGACIVVDFGTATTFTAVSEGRAQGSAEQAQGPAGRAQGPAPTTGPVLMGVAIAPGINLAASALSGGTAQLPQVRLVPPARAIGTNTVHSIQSGILWGYVGLVEGMIGRFKAEMGVDVQVIATGGLSSIIAPLTKAFTEVDPWLTLDGIRLIGECCAA